MNRPEYSNEKFWNDIIQQYITDKYSVMKEENKLN